MNNRFEAGGIGFGMVKNGKNTNYLKIKQQKNTYRRNTYRVLLTRGRDGFIVFIPNQRKLDPVYKVIQEIGIKELDKI